MIGGATGPCGCVSGAVLNEQVSGLLAETLVQERVSFLAKPDASTGTLPVDNLRKTLHITMLH